MKHSNVFHTNRDGGFSLIELLIATTLGLLILVAVVNIFVSSRQSFRTQEGLSQVQETGRLLNYLVYPYIRLAGYLPNPIKQTDPGATYTSATRALQGTDNDSTDDLVKDGSDTITVRYRGQDSPPVTASSTDAAGVVTTTTTTSPDGSITNCAGVRGSDGVSATEVASVRYYVTTATNGISNLQCDVTVTTDAGAATTSSMPILEGVQDLQILYGTGVTDPVTLDRVSQHYYTAATLPASEWTRVTSVRMTVTVDNIDKNVTVGTTTVADNRLRRAFTSTLQIRNRLN